MILNHWRPYTASTTMPWNLARVRHLNWRAGFGATWSELQRDLRDGPAASIERILRGNSRSYAQREDFDSISRVLTDAAIGSEDEDRLRAAWLFRMLFTPHPLLEKLTLVWHNHFATSNLKVANLHWMWKQNEHLRAQALGSFAKLIHTIVVDPAMLIWLDANTNRQGQSNENLARELMELFTLGVGNYTEADVKEAARALTGWTVKSGEAILRGEYHDSQSKTILGKTDAFNAGRLVDWLIEQPATSQRVAWRLCDALMGENVVSAEAMNELASGLREHQLNINWAVSTILASELFFSDINLGSRIGSPVEHVVSTVRSLEMLDAPPSTIILSGWSARMGQELFRPPNVGGWTGGRSWLNTRSIIARANFADTLISGQLRSPADPPPLERVVDRHVQAGPVTADSASELLQILCLGRPSSQPRRDSPKTIPLMVAELLSSPEAFLM